MLSVIAAKPNPENVFYLYLPLKFELELYKYNFQTYLPNFQTLVKALYNKYTLTPLVKPY